MKNNYVGVGCTSKTLAQYQLVIKELTEQEDWFAEKSRVCPICCDIPSIKLYTCFCNKEDVVELRNKLEAEIKRHEEADKKTRNKWWCKFFCNPFVD